MIDKGRILYLHSLPARSMKEFDFTIVVSIAGKNLESAKNKLSGWLEPSLALKKNDAISLASVDLSDNVGSETKKSTKKTKKALPKAKKAKEEPEEEEDDDWDPEWEDADWDSLDEDDDDWDEDEDEDEAEEESAPEESEDDIDWDQFDDDEEKSREEDSAATPMITDEVFLLELKWLGGREGGREGGRKDVRA